MKKFETWISKSLILKYKKAFLREFTREGEEDVLDLNAIKALKNAGSLEYY